jgi:hypothetical protein
MLEELNSSGPANGPLATTGTSSVTAPPENMTTPVPEESQPTFDPPELPGRSESIDREAESPCALRNHVPELQPTAKLTGHDENPLPEPCKLSNSHCKPSGTFCRGRVSMGS